ncbi:MAG TPA: hypothetical protein EYP17_08200 [Candidatus Latescibacteria bacterium]|nr:hypothetical protein [Candidatus Latescibacterota bacterium]
MSERDIPVREHIRQIAHALNNSLVSIIGQAELSLFTKRDWEEAMEEILMAAKRARRWVEQLAQVDKALSKEVGCGSD